MYDIETGRNIDDQRAERQEIANSVRRGWVHGPEPGEARKASDDATGPWELLERRRWAIHNRLMRTAPGTIGAVEAARVYRESMGLPLQFSGDSA